jgi:hypothetical protein
LVWFLVFTIPSSQNIDEIEIWVVITNQNAKNVYFVNIFTREFKKPNQKDLIFRGSFAMIHKNISEQNLTKSTSQSRKKFNSMYSNYTFFSNSTSQNDSNFNENFSANS